MAIFRLKSPLLFFWCALALVLIVRSRGLWAFGEELDRDPDSYRQLAVNIRSGIPYSLLMLFGEDGDDFIGAKAWRPPLYPSLLAMIVPLDTTNFGGWVAGIHLTLGVLTVFAVYALSRKVGLSKGIAAVAAGLVLVDPILIRQSAEVMTETLATFLATICLLALISADRAPDRIKSSLLAGVALGAAVLCRPTFLVWAGLGGVAFVGLDLCQRRFPGRAVAMGIAIAVAVMPWGLRNWHELGKPIVTTTHGGYTFYRANNPLYFEHLRSTPWGTVWDTDSFDDRWRVQMGERFHTWKLRSRKATSGRISQEVLLDRFSYEAAFKAIRNEPGMFLYASALRLSRLYGLVPWQTDPHETARTRWLRYAVGAFYLIEFALVLLGIVALGKKLFAPPWLWGTLLVLSFTLVHTFYWTDMRMRAPLVPVIAMVAAVGLVGAKSPAVGLNDGRFRHCRPVGN